MRIECSAENIRSSSNHLRPLVAAARLIENDGDYSTWSWKIEIENISSSPMRLYVDLNFLDAEGFTLADVCEGEYMVPARRVTKLSKTYDLKRSLSEQVGDISIQLSVTEDDFNDEIIYPDELAPALE